MIFRQVFLYQNLDYPASLSPSFFLPMLYECKIDSFFLKKSCFL